MTILFKEATILDKSSSFHKQVKDVLIENGKITKIEDSLNTNVDTVISEKGLCISQGWIDAHVNYREPGFEYKEDLRLFLRELVINLETPSAVLRAILPENPSVTIT